MGDGVGDDDGARREGPRGGGVKREVVVGSGWAGERDRARCTACIQSFYGHQSLRIKSQMEKITAQSTMAAELIGVHRAAKAIVGIHDCMLESGIRVDGPPEIICDSAAAIIAIENYHIAEANKHIRVRYWYVRELVERGMIVLRPIASANNPADIGTKALGADLFARHDGIITGNSPWPEEAD